MATEAWRWQGGTSGSDEIHAAVMYPDGSSVLAGYTDGNWNTTNAGSYDFMVVKLDVNGSVLWEWEDGTEWSDYIKAAAGADDGSVIIAGNTEGSYGSVNAGAADFVALKIDTDGNTVWGWQNGTDADDIVYALAMSSDGSVVLVGYTEGNWRTTNTGGYDCVAMKLNADGTLAWAWQGGSGGDDYCRGGTIVDDGSVIVAGRTYGSWGGVNAGGYDFVAVKLDAAGELVWVWQDGTSSSEWATPAVATGDGSVVIVGNTGGSLYGTNSGAADFIAVKLDANRTIEWTWQDGSSDWENALGAAALKEGGVVLAAHSWGNWSGLNSGSLDFAAVELDPNGTVLWRWQDGTADYDKFQAAATDGDSRVLLAGYTEGDWSGFNAGDRDFAAILIELPTSDTPLPSLPPTVVPTPSPTPSPTIGRPTIAPSSITTAPWKSVSPPPSSIPAPSSSRQTAPPATETPGPFSTGSTGSSSTSTAMIAGAVTAAVFVVILLLAVWIWRRNTKRQGEGVQNPCSTQEIHNTPYPVANRSNDNPTNGSGSVNPVHSDVPPPDYMTVMYGGTSHTGERMPAPIAQSAETVESTRPVA